MDVDGLPFESAAESTAEQAADSIQRALCRNASQPEGTGPAKQAKEQGLQIVITMVGQPEPRGAKSAGSCREDPVAGLARPTLTLALAQAMDLAGHSQLFTKTESPLCLACGLWP